MFTYDDCPSCGCPYTPVPHCDRCAPCCIIEGHKHTEPLPLPMETKGYEKEKP